ADEPTTALDVTIQAQILEIMKRLKSEFDSAMIMISHDLGVVAEVADRVAVMYAGDIVETGTVEQVFVNPRHPYTVGLIGSLPDIEQRGKSRLKPIHGLMPDSMELPSGCSFHPRCPHVMGLCSAAKPQMYQVGTGHQSRCYLHDNKDGTDG
ncbi:MAG: ABC transporter ATP-binding protein, partial [Spirochaetaceae bacterium]